MIAILSGSSRINSNTLKLGKALQRTCIDQGTEENQVSLISFEDFDIPYFNGGMVDRENLTPFQNNLINSLSQAKIIFLLTPEYNWFPSAEIIQTIHQLATPANRDLFDHKVFAMAGVSSGKGGRIPAVQLSYLVNKVINVFNFESIVSGKIFECQFTPKYLDENGASQGDADFDTAISEFVEFALNISKKWN